MDAKITKERLGNFLAYDWLKIVIAIAIAVAALCVFFTTVSTQPREDQIYELYAYSELYSGGDMAVFEEETRKNAFSYDILDVRYEVFGQYDVYEQTAYQARRAAGQGKAIFVNGRDYVYIENGEESLKNHLVDFVESGISNFGLETEFCNPYLDFPKLFADCEDYLSGVFGENWETSDVPDEAAVKSVFLARNKDDKRFRTAAKKEAGIALERARLIKLRTDYLGVRNAVESGLFSFTPYTSPADKTYTVALNVGRLPKLSELVYYTEEDEDGTVVKRTEDIHFIAYYNGKVSNDLRFESFSLLNWMIGKYA